MDLLAVDFLRVFDENLYRQIACEVPTKHWAMNNLSSIHANNEKKDSARILELISSSQLSSGTACGALLSLFPHLRSHIQQFLDQNQRGVWLYVKTPDGKPALGINAANRTEIYFRLNLHAGELPEAKVKEIIAAADDALLLAKLIQQLQAENWLEQFFGRCRSDPSLFASPVSAANLLHAISQISDDLRSNPGIEDNELRGAFSLSDALVERISRSGNGNLIITAIKSVGDVTLALLLIEQLRYQSKCTYFFGAKSPNGMVQMGEEEIEALCDELFPMVEKRFLMRHFMKGKYEASRAYRMANALGSLRVEAILCRALEADFKDRIWDLAQAIFISISPQIPDYDWLHGEISPEPAQLFMQNLSRFAGREFWKDFVANGDSESLSDYHRSLKSHIEIA
jgi:hypothetical protein